MLSTKINIVFILFLNRPFLSADPLPLDCDSDITITDCKGMYELDSGHKYTVIQNFMWCHKKLHRNKQVAGQFWYRFPDQKRDPFMSWPRKYLSQTYDASPGKIIRPIRTGGVGILGYNL